MIIPEMSWDELAGDVKTYQCWRCKGHYEEGDERLVTTCCHYCDGALCESCCPAEHLALAEDLNCCLSAKCEGQAMRWLIEANSKLHAQMGLAHKALLEADYLIGNRRIEASRFIDQAKTLLGGLCDAAQERPRALRLYLTPLLLESAQLIQSGGDPAEVEKFTEEAEMAFGLLKSALKRRGKGATA